MVVVSAARDYVNRMLQDISGMKVLILDSHTVRSYSIPFDFIHFSFSVNRLIFPMVIGDNICLVTGKLEEEIRVGNI